jgi:hypothetical protein
MKRFISLLALISQCSSHCWADASFSTENNTLNIPYVHYQDNFYAIELSFIPPDKLKLSNVASQTETLANNAIVPLYDNLSLHLSSLTFQEQQYSADLKFVGDNIFQIHNISEIFDALPGKKIFRSQHFSGSGICNQCHTDLKDAAGNDVSIVPAWNASMMANATRDPFWQAKVKSELNRTPSQKELIQDKCTRCHAPMANEESKKQGDGIQAIFGQGILNAANPYHDLAKDGVSCSLCHQISPNNSFGTEAGFSGKFSITTFPTSTERLIYGPFKNVFTRPMQNFANFTPVYSEHIKSSELCASCHDLSTPYTDEHGNVLSTDTDKFPEQMPYSEWLHSDYAETDSCQQCHMPRADGVIIASRPASLSTKRDNFAQHSFLGSNRLMLSILQDYRKELGSPDADFANSILNAEALLNNAAQLAISAATLQNNTLNFNLNISSETGHKLPSGYPSRRVIVHITVRDAQGNIVFESGKVNSDGSVVELDSDQDPTQFEPHYQLIDSPEKVQVYEAVMQDYQDDITFTLIRAKSYVKDNRLLPNGFNKNTVPNKIKVQGLAATDKNFIGGSDVIEFNINNLPAENYTIEAELIYQTLGYAFAQDLFTDPSTEAARFKQMFNASTLKSTSMNTIHFNISKI